MTVAGKILIIEDEPRWVKHLRALLRPQQYTIESTENYSDALVKILEAQAPFAASTIDLCIVDLKLGDSPHNRDGLGVLAFCKIKHIPTIVVSAFVQESGIQELHKEFGVVASLMKGRLNRLEEEKSRFIEAVRDAIESHYSDQARNPDEFAEVSQPDFQRSVSEMYNELTQSYNHAMSTINDRQQDRLRYAGPNRDDQLRWQQERTELDAKYRSAILKLGQITPAILTATCEELRMEAIQWGTQ